MALNAGGTIGALTYGVVDRVEFYAQPTSLSLVPWHGFQVAVVHPFLGEKIQGKYLVVQDSS